MRACGGVWWGAAPLLLLLVVALVGALEPPEDLQEDPKDKRQIYYPASDFDELFESFKEEDLEPEARPTGHLPIAPHYPSEPHQSAVYVPPAYDSYEPDSPKPYEPQVYEPASYEPQVPSYETPVFEDSEYILEPIFRPEPDYKRPQPAYKPPQPDYKPPQPDYKPPQPAYKPPQPAYKPPQPAYKPPQPAYKPPKPAYKPPQPAYKPPQPAYKPPQPAYNPPQPAYKPKPVYEEPGYPAPAQKPYKEENNIPGDPGVDYPIYHQIPYTKFTCAEVPYRPGMYANPEAGCQVYHVCHDDRYGPKGAQFLCTNGTLFNQETFNCDWWYNVDCSKAASLYSLNLDPEHNPYYQKPYEGPLHLPAQAYPQPDPHQQAYQPPAPKPAYIAPSTAYKGHRKPDAGYSGPPEGPY
ncbi:uncharacterized protein [Procambarus clarkii]|uniref:uncharacterized protein n=1 Tax=Procambarus clarkii TaxID=6728 RepID=UPI003741E9C1